MVTSDRRTKKDIIRLFETSKRKLEEEIEELRSALVDIRICAVDNVSTTRGEASMAENKTKPEATHVGSFLKKIKAPDRRKDCAAIIEMMESISGLKPVMWGTAIVGFGTRHYVYDSGREGDTMIVGFSPRKEAIALYLAGGLEPLQDELAKLGKHSTGKGCLYINRLEDVNTAVLKKILTKSFRSVGPNPGKSLS